RWCARRVKGLFFVQAEDGIRDWSVTGVQTCALPILKPARPEGLLDKSYLKERAKLIDPKRAQDFGPGKPPRSGTVYLAAADASRSEERRVGKEWRARWWRDPCSEEDTGRGGARVCVE